MTDPIRQEVQWCITCGARFTKEDVEGASCCPKCASSGVPCATEKDLLLAINWHELRVLCIWASNYAEKLDNDAKLCLRGIIFRLEHQAPNETPLTLGGEVREMRRRFDYVEALNIPSEGLALVHGPGAVGYAKPPKGASHD